MAQSSVQAEFHAMAHGNCKVLELKMVLTDTKVTLQYPIRFHGDDKTKQVEISKDCIDKKIQWCTSPTF